jgi:ABC-type branched-subunit amino acid transport system ATPase component
MKITEELKLKIFNAIKSQPTFFKKIDGEEEMLPFLGLIWDLQNMPSLDGRFSDAYGDIFQHTINNDDWTIDYLFLERLELLKNDEIFISFLEKSISPEYRIDENDILQYVYLINPYLESCGLRLILSSYNSENLPNYILGNFDSTPNDIPKNSIPFFVTKTPLESFTDRVTSHLRPKISPSFALVFNEGWNDYSIRSDFSLFFYASKRAQYIGQVKIIFDNEDNDTINNLDDEFKELSVDFCSLGQSINYYRNLKAVFGINFLSVLFALKDAAFFSDIADKFEKNYKFNNSVIRYNNVERLLRTAIYDLYDYDLNNLYKFQYLFKPVFASDFLNIEFDFNNNEPIPNRIYAIIGKNGTGKTQFISSLPLNISEKKSDIFSPKIPLFSKVIAVSYSSFDNFKIPKKTTDFNYVYCGLRNEDGSLITENELLIRFKSTCERIYTLERVNQLRQILLNFIEEETLNQFIIPDSENNSNRTKYIIDFKAYTTLKIGFSSGQNIIMYIISEIIANIRFDTLLLYDEPETHLHPNAISQLMNTIYELVNEFESYCIITTHSPLIISELFSRNVYVIERHFNTPSIRKIGIESFGENTSVLTEEVFGNKEIPKYYKKVISELVLQGLNFEQIISLLEFDNIPLSLNARLYIKSIINQI